MIKLIVIALLISLALAFNFQDGNGGALKWSMGCDWQGGDIGSAQVGGGACGSACLNKGGCTHFTWTTWNGGTCWFKNGNAKGPIATASSAMCGYTNGGGGGGNPAPAPAPRPAPAPAPGGGGPISNGVTIINNCAGYTVYRSGQPVRAGCLGGNYCNDFQGSNPAFYVKKPDDNFFLGYTFVELNIPSGQAVWYDISKITGFNFGAKIEYSVNGDAGHTVVCNDVNCPDAYWLCDIAVTNKFNPVYTHPPGGGFRVTFCPNEGNSQPTNPSPLGVQRRQSNPGAGPFTCRVKIYGNPSLPGTIVDGGAI